MKHPGDCLKMEPTKMVFDLLQPVKIVNERGQTRTLVFRPRNWKPSSPLHLVRDGEHSQRRESCTACGSGTCDTEEGNSPPHRRGRFRQSGNTSMDGTSREWNRSNIVLPCPDALQVARVDVLEIGGPPNSVLVDERSKLNGSFFCVNQQTGHSISDPGIRRQESRAVGTGATTRKCCLDVARRDD